MGSESKVEGELKQMIEKHGGICYKFTSPSRVGVPDRLCIFNKSLWFMVETKSEDGVVKPWQEREHVRLRGRGVRVFVLHDSQSIWYLEQWLLEELT
jgi:hypothetical protein